jgi:pyrimidine deaminase RibD-like protein
MVLLLDEKHDMEIIYCKRTACCPNSTIKTKIKTINLSMADEEMIALGQGWVEYLRVRIGWHWVFSLHKT